MKQYLDALAHIRNNGDFKEDRTGTGTLSVFGHQMSFDLQEGFPLVTTKKCHIKSIVHELLWFLKGDTNIRYLQENGVKIWDAWADENGNLGPVYGAQWRSWPAGEEIIDTGIGLFRQYKCIDQISEVIESIKNDPNSRRHIVTAWNPAEVNNMALPPCHMMFQFYVVNGKLSCQLYQRSADMFLGVPFNIASYALLTMMIAQVCDLDVGEFIWTGGDCHIYSNHMDQVDLQLTREPLRLPYMQLNPEITNIFDFKYEDIQLLDYLSHDGIIGEVAV